MTLTSNLAGVLRQVERLQVNLPVAAERALQWGGWLELAIADARQQLEALALPPERKFIGDFLQTVQSFFQSPTLALTMNAPVLDELLQETEAARQRVADALADGNPPNADDLLKTITHWVETPVAEGGKRRDARDDRKTADEIAKFITFLFSAPESKLIGERRAAREALSPHVFNWIATANLTLTRATVDLWLRAVLASWRELVRKHFPARMRAELRIMKDEL